MKMWISRDKDKRLLLFDIDYREFPEVTFENSPQEVELVMKK